MRGDILGAAKDVHQIDLDRYLNELAVDLLFKDMGDLRVINRYWNDLEAYRFKITGNIKGWLTCLRPRF